jgi:Antirestriction protein
LFGEGEKTVNETTNEPCDPVVTAERIPDGERLNALPRHFGVRSMLRVESAVYASMREIARDYSGGYWHYYELSNGGFYMAPDASIPFAILVQGNGFSGILSADAVGIVASLFGINRVSFSGCDRCVDQFYRLRDFALSHAEQRQIFRAID